MKKKLLILALLVNAFLLTVRIVQHTPPARAGEAPVPSGNGDLDANGSRDIGDVVYMLFWLFRGGPAPVAIAQSADLEERVAVLEAEVAALAASQPTASEIAAEIAESHIDVLRAALDPTRSAIVDLERLTGARSPAALGESLESMTRVDPRQDPLILELEGEELPVLGLVGHEAISRPFHFELLLEEPREGLDLEPAGLPGAPARLRFTHDAETVVIHGILDDLGPAGRGEAGGRYRAELVPELARLDRGQDLAIYQNRLPVELVNELCQLGGVTEPTALLEGNYEPREFCVQYRESDFAFLSRVLEEAGLYYYFTQADGEPEVRIGDSGSAHDPLPRALVYHGHLAPPPDPGEERITSLTRGFSLAVERVTLDDFDFTKPSTELRAIASEVEVTPYELYDYPGKYSETDVGLEIARHRLEAERVQREILTGTSNAKSLRPGHRLTIVDRTGPEFDGRYIVLSVEHLAVDTRRHVAAGSGELHYVNRFTCIPDRIPFRPGRTTPPPRIAGPQTAVVVGAGGQEIWTDEFGRVKVQFHWDRLGANDENSSAWIRVSQIHAGRGFGAIDIPRVGEEVIVDFLEGDPDRPLVTGRVYNAENITPYTLPDNRTQSGIKSSSSPGGGNGNELRFDDLAGSEEVYLEGARDMTVVIGNDLNMQTDNAFTLSTGTDLLMQGTDLAITATAAFELEAAVTARLTAPNLRLTAIETRVDGHLASAADAGPDRTITPGHRHRDNAIIAWARVSATGSTTAGEFGILSVENLGVGHYRIELDVNLPPRGTLEIVPVVTPVVKGQPTRSDALRFATIAQIGEDTFDVFINSPTVPINGAFQFMATAR